MIKAVIIDDEERAQRVLKNLLLEINEPVEVVAMCANLPEGVIQINKHKPDVVFLDIEMPNYSGLEILNFFDEVTFEIIFATGYSNYAIRAFELSAIDYLLKPIDEDKLEMSIQRLRKKLKKTSINERLEILKESFKKTALQKIALPISDGFIFIEVDTISILEAEGSYTKVWINDGSNILVSKNLKQFEQLLLQNKSFFRSHRSNIINLNLIEKYSKQNNYLMMEGGKSIPISKTSRIVFENYIKKIKP